jgi:hypothetical protein
MKNVFVKLALAAFMAFVVTIAYSLIQYVCQAARKELYIRLGFPYEFYFFTPDFELHGVKMLGFIFDSLLVFVFSFLVIQIAANRRKKRTFQFEKELIDETTTDD